MTSPVDQASLQAEMEALSVIYVTTQAFAIDSLVNSAVVPDPWNAIGHQCRSASEQIYKAIKDLIGAYYQLRSIT